MKQLKLGICFLDEEDKVISKRVLGTNWSINTEQDLKEKFDIRVEDEIATVLTENLKLQLTTDVVKEMLGEVKGIES